tara:strand:- start:152 stop:1333 length:1182 start_codon:yes stop_codon:yes gene_type:complete
MKNDLNTSSLSDNFIGQGMFEILNVVQKLEREGKKIYHFELGEPHHETHPKIVNKLISSIKNGNTRYTSSFGLYDLREKIRLSTKYSRNFKPDIEQVLITPGANSIIYFLIKTICNKGDEVILPNPGFPSYIAACRANGVKIRTLNLNQNNNYQIEYDSLSKLINKKTKLLIINSPSNPLGVIQNKNNLIDIYNLIKKNNIYVLTDEIYSRITFNKNEFFSISTLDKCKKNVVILNGFSKSFSMTGYRVGCAIGPKDIINKMRLLVETIVSCVPPFIQESCSAALDLNNNFVLKNNLDYLKKRNKIISKFNQTKLEFVTPNGAFYIFPSLKRYGVDGETFCRNILLKYGIALVPGIFFGSQGNYNFRMSYTSDTRSLEKALDLILTYLKSIQK